MEKLIIRRGMTKQAANEDGPSFEHQFGILSNAIIADKFPQLDRMKLAFQLIEKTEDNSDACGAVVYAVGKSIIFIPSFFRNNKLKTGDMFFIAQTQQFLPLSDPWLAWLKNKDLTDVAKEIPKEFSDGIIGPKGTTIREIADPLVKSASVFLRGLLHLEPDMQKSVTDASLLDTAIAMGKQASEALLDNMIKNQDFLNSTLAFYSGDALDTFAKQATALTEEPVSSVELILPLDKEASSLNKQELNALHRDGFFIRKQASDITPVVIRKKQLSGMFTKINGAGKHKALQTSGEIEDALIMKCIDLDAHVSKMQIDKDILPYQPEPAGEYALVSSGGAFTIPRGAMCLAGQSEDFSASFIDNVGFALKHSTVKQIPYRALLVFPTGEYARVYTELLADTN